MNLKKLISGTAAEFCGADVEIEYITDCLEQVHDGALFVCVRGQHTDGHQLAAQAISEGARAVVCEHTLGIANEVIVPDTRVALAQMSAALYGYPARQLSLIGVTGTNGKTTVSVWIRHILEQAGKKSALIGTLGADSGDGFEDTGHTTPDSTVFNRKLRESVDGGCAYAVAEISSQALSQERCAGFPFEIAVFTNLSPEHLDYHKTMEAYAGEKAKLFKAAGTAVLNADDLYTAGIRQVCQGKVVTFSVHDDADYTAKNITVREDGVSYILVSGEDIARVNLSATGLFSVYNSMAAIAACVEAGVPFGEACICAGSLPAVPGRMQRVIADAPFSVYVDYAHTPMALHAVLHSLRQTVRGKQILVFGCGGERDPEKRSKMGEIASGYAALTVLTDDNPRSEDPRQILEQIASGFKSKNQLIIEPDRRKAIAMALKKAKPGDCVLIAGKGHEKVQITAQGSFPFDDVKTAEEIWNSSIKK